MSVSTNTIKWYIAIDLNRADLTSEEFGIVAGVMRIVTGGDTTTTGGLYKGGLLLADGIPSHFQYADIQGSGAYSSFSSMSISISIATGFYAYIKANKIILRGSDVVFSASKGLPTPLVKWVGKINASPVKRTSIVLACLDSFNTIHSEQPSTLLNADDPTVTVDGFKPLVVGSTDYGKMVYQTTLGQSNIDLESGGVLTAVSDNIKILGIPCSSDRQGAEGSNGYFVPTGWSNLTLYCGDSDSIASGSLKGATLTFTDEITGRPFYGVVRGNSASYKVFEHAPSGGTSVDKYGVDVYLDKAVNVVMTTISDEELNYDCGNRNNELTFGITRLMDYDVANFSKYSELFKSSFSPYDNIQKNGLRTKYCGREYVLKDYDSAIAHSHLEYPLNAPSSFAMGASDDEETMVANDGVLQWIPAERISKLSFKPMTYMHYYFSIVDGEFITVPSQIFKTQSPYSEPFVYTGFYPVLPAVISSTVYDADYTTLATLKASGATAKFLLGSNAINGASTLASVHTSEDELIERKFVSDIQSINIANPEFVDGVVDDGTLPVALSYMQTNTPYPTTADIVGGVQACGAVYLDHNSMNAISSSATISTTEISAYSADFGDDMLSYQNDGTDYCGDVVVYTNTKDGTQETGVSPVVWDRDRLLVSYPLTVGYKRHHWLEIHSLYLPKGSDSTDVNFLSKIYFEKLGDAVGVLGLDSIYLEMEVDGYTNGDIGDKTGAELTYESGLISLYSMDFDYTLWDTLVAGNVLFKVGSLTFDIGTDDLLFSANIPDDITENMQGEWFEYKFRVRIDASPEIVMGLRPSYFALNDWVDGTGDKYTHVTRYVNRGMSFSSGVHGVISEFDSAPLMLGEDIDACDTLIYAGGGGVSSIGEQYVVATNTFDICRTYATKGFFGITINSEGQRIMIPWLYMKDPLFAFESVSVTSGAVKIIDKTLEELGSTPYSMVYTRGLILYSGDSSGTAQESLQIAETERDEFPAIDEYTWVDDDLNIRTMSLVRVGSVIEGTVVGDTMPSTWEIGVLLGYTNANDVIFTLQVLTFSADGLTIYFSEPFGDLAIGTTIGVSWDLQAYSAVLSWEACIKSSLSISYSDAKDIWTPFQTAYTRRGGHNDIPSSLASVPELTGGTTAYNVISYLTNIANWCTFVKDTAKFKVSAHDVVDSTMSMFDCVTINDPILTLGVARTAWIFSIAYAPKTEVVSLELILDLDPLDVVETTTTIDEGTEEYLAVNDIDETFDDGTTALPTDDIDEEMI